MIYLVEMFVVVSIATGLWYLGAAAGITFRVREVLANVDLLKQWLDCPACSGTWYGVGLAITADAIGRPVLGLGLAAAMPVTGFVCMVWVPTLSEKLLSALTATGEYIHGGPTSEVDQNGSQDANPHHQD